MQHEAFEALSEWPVKMAVVMADANVNDLAERGYGRGGVFCGYSMIRNDTLSLSPACCMLLSCAPQTI